MSEIIAKNMIITKYLKIRTDKLKSITVEHGKQDYLVIEWEGGA